MLANLPYCDQFVHIKMHLQLLIEIIKLKHTYSLTCCRYLDVLGHKFPFRSICAPERWRTQPGGLDSCTCLLSIGIWLQRPQIVAQILPLQGYAIYGWLLEQTRTFIFSLENNFFGWIKRKSVENFNCRLIILIQRHAMLEMYWGLSCYASCKSYELC